MEAETLGPLQAVWDAWDEVHALVMAQPDSHFAAAIQLQLAEAAAEPVETRTKEVIDVISVALNWLRYLGHTPESTAQAIRDRAGYRYAGQSQAIFVKYRSIMKPEDIL